ncbi:alkene reductase [Nocardiopsis sp. LOL_012]|uniref:oxidoreductase n=1 Tax=Nocardiopsis sp. LOL_012 TaxID=3345409 RepID=UPI003A8B7A51
MTKASASKLWQPLTMGGTTLRNRLVLSPMTRRRAAADGTPTALMAEYYTQRAGFGLIVTEGLYPGPEGRDPNQPGLTGSTHTHGWSAVTRSVRAHGTPVFAQLMHAGRVTSPSITGIDTVLAPSAVAYDDHHGHHPGRTMPEATAADITHLVQAHAEAARRARRAGFDGVELHAANGYLLHQFLAPSTNLRTDKYGGSPRRRARFVTEAVEAVADAIGANRVGIRISPGANIQGSLETDEQDVSATYTALLEGLESRPPAYVSMIHPTVKSGFVQELRRRSGTHMIANTGFSQVTDRHTALETVDAGHADAVAVGRPAISNPDLAQRRRHDRPETAPITETFYTGGARGYTGYPTDGVGEARPVRRPSSEHPRHRLRAAGSPGLEPGRRLDATCRERLPACVRPDADAAGPAPGQSFSAGRPCAACGPRGAGAAR